MLPLKLHMRCWKCLVHDAASCKTKTILCIIIIQCFPRRELDAMSGHWFYSKFRRSKRHRRTNAVVSGGELVKASFRHTNRPEQFQNGRLSKGAQSFLAPPTSSWVWSKWQNDHILKIECSGEYNYMGHVVNGFTGHVITRYGDRVTENEVGCL